MASFLKEIINKDQFYHSFISWILSFTKILTFLQFRVCVSFSKSIGLESRDEDDCNLQKWHIKHVICLFIYILEKFLFWIQSDKNAGREHKDWISQQFSSLDIQNQTYIWLQSAENTTVNRNIKPQGESS